MFDKLIELLAQWWNFLMPAVIIPDYEEAVLLRAGRFKKVLKPGFHVKLPIVDEVVQQHVVVTTLSLSAQSLYTKDKQNVVVKGVVKYRISDVKVFLLEVFDAQDALADMTQSIIKNIIISLPLEACIDPEIDNTLTKKVRVEAKKWGVDIQQVTLTDIAPIRSFRLINDTVTNKLD
ncbi:MAG: SPFH domain-containing protein [Cytophagia bacterium]|nr:SPFH domain-containing protein [Cytophagia bacterium]